MMGLERSTHSEFVPCDIHFLTRTVTSLAAYSDFNDDDCCPKSSSSDRDSCLDASSNYQSATKTILQLTQADCYHDLAKV
jgi:hypothetical protein